MNTIKTGCRALDLELRAAKENGQFVKINKGAKVKNEALIGVIVFGALVSLCVLIDLFITKNY